MLLVEFVYKFLCGVYCQCVAWVLSWTLTCSADSKNSLYNFVIQNVQIVGVEMHDLSYFLVFYLIVMHKLSQPFFQL